MTLEELLRHAKARGLTPRKLALAAGNPMLVSSMRQREKKGGDPFSAGQRQLLTAIEAAGGKIVFTD